MFNLLKTRIIMSNAGVIAVLMVITIFFFGQSLKDELSDEIEKNALNLLEGIKNHVESEYNSILYHKSSMLSRRKIELKNNTTIAFAIINSEYRRFKKGQISEDTAKNNVSNTFRQLFYDDGIGYFWVNDTNRPYPKMIVHPIIPELNGMILNDPKFNCAFGKEKNIFRAFVNVCLEKEEGFVDYLWPKPRQGGLTEQQAKLSYVKIFRPWNWIIGTGVYIDDIEKDVQNRINAVIEDLNKTITKKRVDQSGYFFIFNENNVALVHPYLAGMDVTSHINPLTGNMLLDEMKKAAFNPEPSMEYMWDKPGFEGEYRFLKKAYLSYYKPLGWYIGSLIYKEDLEKKISNLTKRMILFSCLFFVLALIISILVSRSITNPLKILIQSIGCTDKDGIPVERILETGTSEIKLLGSTINSMIYSVSQSRKALRQSEAKFRNLIESSSDWIWEVNIDGIYTYTSPQVEALLGYKVEEVLGRLIFDFMLPKEAERIWGIFKAVVEKGKPVILLENINLHKNGRPVVFETSGVPVLDEAANVTGYRGMNRDITERKQQETEVRQLRNYLSNIIDSMPSVLVGVDADIRLTLWNKTAENITELDVGAAKGKRLSDVFPQMATEVKKISESIRTRKIKQEKKRTRISGKGTCYENITIYPLIANGVEGAVIQVEDVTEQVRLEMLIVQSEKMLSVGGLAAGMAHEINNPLAGMMQTAKVMSNRLGGKTNIAANIKAAQDAGISMDAIRNFMEAREIPRMLRTINESGKRVADIVENMLGFARKSEANVSFCFIPDLIDKTLELAASDYDFKKQYDFKLIEVKKYYDNNLPYVLCEEANIQQVILNVLRNGAQAMQSKKPLKPIFIIRVLFEKKRKMLVIEIEDNGPGIDLLSQKRIFEPFYTTKSVGDGTGLGLSVSYFIIAENHGGEMAVESEPGFGTKFIIRLPLEKERGGT